jgi:hypothetical protein
MPSKNEKKDQDPYPLIKKYKIPTELYPGEANLVICPWDDLRGQLEALGIASQFSAYFGIQTTMDKGPFASDVEAVLNRIYKKKVTGTQLHMD